MKKIKIIGITGQSGAGKSTVTKYFEEIGAVVINADLLVRELYKPDSICVKILSTVFGKGILSDNGGIDKKALAEIAFKNKKNTDLLNSLVHPFVTDLLIKKVGEAKNNGQKLIVYDAPQLFESGFDAMCDIIIGIVADEKTRLKRICERDCISPDLAKKRFNAQYSEKFFREKSDYVIENNGDLDSFSKAIDKMINGGI